MPRRAKSQWDFGELFPPAETRRVFTVAALTQRVKRLIEDQLGRVWVSGEVTNLRFQASGHAYFTLKDATAQLQCVLFRGETGVRRDLLADGRKLLVQGDVTVYEPRGQYQLIVVSAELEGVGALQLAFERLKQKLQAEGLFAAERKRPLPRYLRRLGVVTSPTGAALRDVLHVVARRFPALELVLAPCRVQGENAAGEIAAAVRLLNTWSAQQTAGRGLDLILVTRGGGSLEDLWAFNEEVVARALFESALPVVSAVGHEIDFTISDFVADVRAATPSAAAEIVTAGPFASREWLATLPDRLRSLARQRLGWGKEAVASLAGRLGRAHPRRRLRVQEQRLDELQSTLGRIARFRHQAAAARLQAAVANWRRFHPSAMMGPRRERLQQLARQLPPRARDAWQRRVRRIEALAARLRLLSPDNVLARGYSITREAETGQIVREAQQTHSGQVLSTRLRDGEVRSIVE